MQRQVSMPHSPGALVYFEEANDLLDRGEYKKAIQRYNRAIELAPNFSIAYSMKRLAEKQLRHPSNKHIKMNSFVSNVWLLILVLVTCVMTYLSMSN